MSPEERERHLTDLEAFLVYLRGLPGTSVTEEWLAAYRDLRASVLAAAPVQPDQPIATGAGIDPKRWAKVFYAQ